MSLISRVTGLFRRKLDDDLDAELRCHLEMRAEMNMSAGMPEGEARQAARHAFGNATLIKEETRRADILPWLETVLQDVRYAVRSFRQAPGFAAAAVLTLALGIGVNAAVFNVINAVLLRPLPYHDPARLVRLDETKDYGEAVRSEGISAADYLDLRAGNHTLAEFGIYSSGNFALTGLGPARRVQSCELTASLLRALGVQPLRGRWFTADDEVPGRSQQVIISYGLWQRAFGGRDPLGSTLTLNDKPYTVVGVMPGRFEFPIQEDAVEVWTPLALDAAMLEARGAHIFHGIGRLNPQVSAPQAHADLELVTRRLQRQSGGSAPGAMLVEPLKASMVAPIRGSLLMAGGAVACVLLIAGANLAGLLLARTSSRRHEIAVRIALGASRRRVLRQWLTESVLLGLLGGGLGLGLSAWAARMLLAIKPADLPVVGKVGVDVNVLLFTLAASLLGGLLFGLAPALHASRGSVHGMVKDTGAHMSVNRSRVRLRRALVGGEMALSLVLLCGAGVMVRTLMKLRAVDPGFRSERILTAEVLLPKSKYGSDAVQREFARSLLERLKAQPGIGAAGATSNLPMAGGFVYLMQLPGGRSYPLFFHSVTPDYFATMHMTVVRGRGFRDADQATAEPVAVISEMAARDLFPNEDPIGKRLKNGFVKQAPQIVGVVRDVRGKGLTEDGLGEMYLPFNQKPWPFLRLAMRGAGNPKALAATLREQVHALDRDLPVDKIRTLDALVGESIATQRFYMLLLATFAALAVGLALVGIYGVVSFETAQRTREIGIRVALGARPSAILQLTVAQGVMPALIGLLVGFAGALAAVRALRSLVFGVTTHDPLTFAVVPLLLIGAALLATLVPARRVIQVDPMVALREE